VHIVKNEDRARKKVERSRAFSKPSTGVYTAFGRSLAGPLGISRLRLNYKIKMDQKLILLENVHWISLPQKVESAWAVVNTAMNHRIPNMLGNF
jgi:hypothetical protein